MKYTVQVYTRKIKRQVRGYLDLPNYIYRHVEANSEADAIDKAVQAVDPYLEPDARYSSIVDSKVRA